MNNNVDKEFDKLHNNKLRKFNINRHNFALTTFRLFLFFIILTIFSANFLSADVISLNSGGSTNLSVSTDRYIEGFFFGIEEAAAAGGGEPPGGGGGPPPTANIRVDPTAFNINLEVNTNVERTIRVTNIGRYSATAGVSQQGLDNMIILGNTSLTIPAGQAAEMKVIFVASNETGIFTGRIIIDGVQILVSLNVKTKFLLFDSNIVVLNGNYEVNQGDKLRTLVTLIPLGDPQRLDVTLNFIIKDYANRVYLTKTETLLVENQTELRRNFETGTLPVGDYVVGLELVYPNGVAPSSAHFKVTPPISFLGRIVIFLIIMILVILIIIIILIRRRRKREQGEVVEETGET